MSATLISLALVAIPVLGAHAFDGRTSASTLDALIVAISIFVTGHGGAIALSGQGIDGVVTVPPLGLTLVFIAVGVAMARRLGQKLGVVGDDWTLRPGGLRTLGIAGGAYCFVYAALCTLVSMAGASATIKPVVVSACASAAALAAVSVVTGFALALRIPVAERDPYDPSATAFINVIPRPMSAALRSVAATVLVMSAGAALALTVQLILRRGAMTTLFRGLDADWFGGAILTLGQLAFLPTLIVWTVVVMCGGTVAVGVGTGISLSAASVGLMPALPVLGALPEPGDMSPWLRLLMLVPVAAVTVGAVLLARATIAMDSRDRLMAWIAFPVTLYVGILVLAGLASGAIGNAQLSEVGPVVSSLALPLLAIVAVPTAAIGGWSQTGLDDLAASKVAALRAKVDSAEQEQE